MYDVIIIGSGPSGLTAAIYTSRANLKTLVLGGVVWGGELMQTTEVENFPGFPEGIQGPDLMMAIRKQAEKYGAQIKEENFTSADYNKRPFVVKSGDKTYETKSIIIATGACYSLLDVPGEKEFTGKGVSYCATCDAAFFRGKNVAIIGGGDTALTEAIFLAKFAEKVMVIHRRDVLRASKVMQDKALSNEKITFVLNTRIEEVLGEQKVQTLRLKSKINPPAGGQNSPLRQGFAGQAKLHLKSQNLDREEAPEQIGGKSLTTKDQELTWELPIDGVFVAVGYKPKSDLFPEIEKDEKGYIKRKENTMTSIDGIFVAGDVSDNRYKQAIVAAGFGCQAALDVEQWLADSK